MKLDILAFGAHPDDVELSCGGTLLRHIAEGKKAGIADLTRGELGTRGTPETRKEEARLSAEILGLTVRESMNLADGFFQSDEATLRSIVRVLRKYQPEVVLANAVSDRHPDHGRAAKLIADACFYSGLRRIETTDDGKAQDPWRPKALFHYVQDHYIRPDFVIDITPWIEQKMKSIRAYKSQFYTEGSTNTEPATSISSKEFIDFLYARCADFGRFIHVPYAEGYTVARTPGIRSFFDLQ